MPAEPRSAARLKNIGDRAGIDVAEQVCMVDELMVVEGQVLAATIGDDVSRRSTRHRDVVNALGTDSKIAEHMFGFTEHDAVVARVVTGPPGG